MKRRAVHIESLVLHGGASAAMSPGVLARAVEAKLKEALPRGAGAVRISASAVGKAVAQSVIASVATVPKTRRKP